MERGRENEIVCNCRCYEPKEKPVAVVLPMIVAENPEHSEVSEASEPDFNIVQMRFYE